MRVQATSVDKKYDGIRIVYIYSELTIETDEHRPRLRTPRMLPWSRILAHFEFGAEVRN